MSKKAQSIKSVLESKGYTNVRVRYERIGSAMDMCGNSGGWIMESDQTHDALGFNYDEAFEAAVSMEATHD